jgi:hypothetical protein
MVRAACVSAWISSVSPGRMITDLKTMLFRLPAC